jgi:serine/threonine-protein kinase
MKRALELNPKDAQIAQELGGCYKATRNYLEAERYFDRAISLAPDASEPYVRKASNYWLWNGSTAKSRATLEKMPKKQEARWTRVWFSQDIYEKNYQSALDRLSVASEVPIKNDTDFITRSELEGVVFQLMKQPEKARVSFDAARLLLEGELRKTPEDHRVHKSLGIVYAGLGRKQDAIREAKLAMELFSLYKDSLEAPVFIENLALVYVMTGEYNLAFDQIEYLLSVPAGISVPLLKLDPRWDPLRNHPRYAQLIQKYQHEPK